jgi:threonylcarbamoyladenosine tRNA methylthiotransferase MtaB
MTKPKVAFHTLGCKLNFAETSTLGKQFLERGFEITDFDSASDVILLNTCSVTERAEREARQWIRRALRHSPHAFVIVTGCYAQLQPEEIASIDGVDVVLGSQEKFHLFQFVDSFQKKQTPQVFVSPIAEAHDFGPAYSSEVGERTRAFLKVQDGCDYPCAFCTIPLARGESRSQPIATTVQQVNQLVAMGFKEIVLSGVNVGDYGKKNDSSFFQLLLALENVDGVKRYRISSIEPNLLTNEIIDFIRASDKFCNHFHIPLQSGSDAILRKMRRRYSSAEYRNVVDYIRSNDADAGIGVDVIVGFPGETEHHFNETYQFLVELPCSYLHVFTYSERPNTFAETLDEPVEPRVRFERNEMLRMLSAKKRHAFYASFQGKIVDVLIEQKQTENGFSGLTKNYLRVNVPANECDVNTIQRVRIEEICNEHCIGSRVDGTVHLPSYVSSPLFNTPSQLTV